MFKISGPQQHYLLALARHAIASQLGVTPAEPEPPAEQFTDTCGAFVTLRVGGQLRGCIGTMSSEEPLPRLIRDMAQSSAFRDPRFPPVTAAELSSIEIELSLLSPLVRVRDVSEIEPGTHGIYLVKGRRSGVLLPQVASEHGWDRTTFLEQTARKAGLPSRSYLDADVALYVFSAVICSET